MSLDSVSKDIAKKIASYFKSRNAFFAFSAVNKTLRGFFEEDREEVIQQGKIILGDNKASFFLTFSGELYACGENYYRQLGVGDRNNRYRWTRTGPPNKKVIRIVSKSGNTFAFCDDGLYACGTNSWGQLGVGDDRIKEGWLKIGPPGKTVLEVEATLTKIFLRCEDGWYGAGQNSWGEFGTGDTKDRWEWVQIKIFGKAVFELIAQDTYTLVRYENRWYGCGSNHSCELISNKHRWEPALEWVEITPPDRTVLKLISTPHTVFVECNNGWYARGGNARGRRANDDKTDALDWMKVIIKYEGKTIFELRTSDTGESTYVRCNDGWHRRGLDPIFRDSYDDMDPDRFVSFEQAKEQAKRECDMPFWNPLKFGDKKIIEIKSSDGMNIFIRCEDGWYGFGKNSQGQLGTGENKKIRDWIKIGPEGKQVLRLFSNMSTFVLCEDGWYACGNNYCGQLGAGDRNERLQWIKVPLPTAQPTIIPSDENEVAQLKITL